MKENRGQIIDKIMERALHELGEHCESVRIFASYKSEECGAEVGTINMGAGNILISRAQIREWLQEQDAYIDERKRVLVRRDMVDNEDDENDSTED